MSKTLCFAITGDCIWNQEASRTLITCYLYLSFDFSIVFSKILFFACAIELVEVSLYATVFLLPQHVDSNRKKANQSIVVVGSLVLWQVSPIRFNKMMIYSTSTILSTNCFFPKPNCKIVALRGLVTHWMIYHSFKGKIKALLNAE